MMNCVRSSTNLNPTPKNMKLLTKIFHKHNWIIIDVQPFKLYYDHCSEYTDKTRITYQCELCKKIKQKSIYGTIRREDLL